MTIPLYRKTGQGKSKRTGKGKGKHVDVVETEQPQPSETASTVSYPSQDPSVIGELSCVRQQGHKVQKSHKKECSLCHVATDLSNSSIFIDLTVAEGPPRETSSKMGQASLEEDNGTYVRSISVDVIDRCHEVHRSELYVQNEETFPIPIKYVDVMRQTRTSIDNASEHTLNEYWNEENGRHSL